MADHARFVWVAALVTVMVVVGGTALALDGQVIPARWTTREAESRLVARSWGDGRIVETAECLGLDPTVRPGETEAAASEFACRTRAWWRPDAVAPATWDEVARAVRGGDPARVHRLVRAPAGLPDATGRDWGLGAALPSVVGLRVDSQTASTIVASQLSASQLDGALDARGELLEAVPALEAYAFNAKTYAGASAQTLRPIDAAVSPALVLVSADANRYCAQVTVGSETVSYAGPDGTPRLRAC